MRLDDEGGRFAALVALAGIALLAAVVVTTSTPPDPVPAAASAERFSADRALRHVEALAREPRPVGSSAHAKARDYLLSELERLGLDPEVQGGTGLWTRGDRTLSARIENVIARIPGRDSTGAVLLMAHYDSRALTFGAGDDASGSAALLETAGAVMAGGELRNDLIFLWTDGEELGLLGAEVFAAEHPLALEVAAVLNFEARGNRGRALMFETGPDNLRDARLLRAAPHPIASSLSSEVYRRMPNDTDFTVFRRRGLPGLNFAFIGGHPAYHSLLDTPQALSRGSLQHLGESALAMARAYGQADLAAVISGDAIYFNPWGSWLVVYSTWWGELLAGATILAVAVALFALARRRWVTGPGLAAALGLQLGLVVAGSLAGYALWWSLDRFAPQRLETPHGLPYASGWLTVALVVVLLGATAFASARFPGVVSRFDLGAGTAVFWALLTGVAAFAVPGASFLFVWPALAVAVALLVVAPGGRRSSVADRGLPGGAESIAWAVPAAVVCLLWAPTVGQVSEALSLRSGEVVGAVAVVALLPLMPLLRRVLSSGEGTPRASRLAALLAFSGLLVGVVSVALSKPTAERPSVDSLLYLEEPGEDRARWLSLDAEIGEWTRGALGTEPERVDEIFYSLRGARWAAAAPPLDLPVPRVEVMAEERSEEGTARRRLEVRLRSLRAAPVLRLDATSSVPLELLAVDGKDVGSKGPRDELHFVAFAVPPEGVLLTIRVEGRWPIEAIASDQSFGLPAAATLPPRPEHRMTSSSWQAESTWVAGRALF